VQCPHVFVADSAVSCGLVGLVSRCAAPDGQGFHQQKVMLLDRAAGWWVTCPLSLLLFEPAVI